MKEFNKLTKSSFQTPTKTWIPNQPFLPRYLISLLHQGIELETAMFIYVGNSVSCYSLVVDSLYDEVPFLALLSDSEKGCKMLQEAFARIIVDKKKTAEEVTVLFEWIAQALPKLRTFLNFNSTDSVLVTHFKGITDLVTCTPDIIIK